MGARIPSVFPRRMYVAILMAAGLLPPIFFTLFGWINGVYADTEGQDWLMVLLDIGISIFYTVVIGLTVIRYLEWLRVRLPWEAGIARRLLATFLGTNLIAGLVMLGLASLVHTWVYPCTGDHPQHSPYHYPSVLNLVLVSLMMNNLLAVLFEGMIIFRDLQEAKFLAEKLEREKLASQLELLQNQLKPHFLFNSLNVLSALVHTDPDKSEAFIAAFSQVYRYVLDTYTQPLVPLSRELGFIRTYLFLQKIRFEDAFHLTLDESQAPPDAYLPPLSLQLALENAFKHNTLSAAHPLLIELRVQPTAVEVRNRYQPPASPAETSGLGQENLRQRYHLLGVAGPTFGREGEAYVACLPLIIDPE